MNVEPRELQLDELLEARDAIQGERSIVMGVGNLAWLIETAIATLQAPCTARSDSPEAPVATPSASTPASATSAPPGKSTDGEHRLPAKPAAPLPPDERKLADKLSVAAETMIASFRPHLDRCHACAIAWQSLRNALGSYQSATK